MDVYGSLSTSADCFHIDDLLDFSTIKDDILSSSTTAATTSSSSSIDSHNQLQPLENQFNYHHYNSSSSSVPFFSNSSSSTDFTKDICVPSDEAAELEWLSQFVDDSFNNFPANEITGSTAFQFETSFLGRARSKKLKAPAPSSKSDSPATEKSKSKAETREVSSQAASTEEGVVRRCTHCASEKTPQWRTGPLGPKTLCNACGVRYKSGRLVPEYRPASSPTFVLTRHSNSHRKVLELRRQKEEQQKKQEQSYRHQYDFKVC